MFEESVSIWASMNSWFTPTILFVFLNLMIGTIFITSSLATQKHKEEQRQQEQLHQLPRSPSMLQRLKSINLYNFRSQESITNYAPTSDFNTHFTFQHEHEHEQEPQHHHYHQQQQQQTHSTPQQEQQPHFSRSPSILQRLKSINFYSSLSQESTSPSTTPTTTTTFNMHKTQETETTHDSFQQTHEQEPDELQLELEQDQTLDEIYSQLQGIHVSRTKSDTKPASGEIPTKLARKMKKSASAKSAFGHFGEEEVEDVVEARRPATVREGKAKVTEVGDDQVDAKADDFINKFKHQLKLQRIESFVRYKEMITRGSGK